MRLASMLLLTILFSGFSIGAYAIEPGDIAEPSISAPDMSMPKPIITRPSMDVPQTQPRQPGESSATPGPAANQTDNVSSDQTPGMQPEDKPLDVSGKWSIKFDNAANRWLDLTLWSTAGTSKVMGFGKLIVGSAENPVTAVGSLTGQQLILNIKSATSDYSGQNPDEYDLDLFLENNTMSGTYLLNSGGEQSGQGNATAARR